MAVVAEAERIKEEVVVRLPEKQGEDLIEGNND